MCRKCGDYDTGFGVSWHRRLQPVAQKAFEAVFGKGNVIVDYCGNCLAAVSLVRGLAAEELPQEALELKDPDYEVIVTVVARKA